MKIKSVRIENFRSIKNETVSLNDYTCLVGPNGAGKSTVLAALNVFFRESLNAPMDLTSLQEEDFHKRTTAQPIEITVTFCDLSEDAKQELKHYVRQDELVVTAVARFDPETQRADVRQYGQRQGMMEFAAFFQAETEGASVADLKAVYARIREGIAELPAPGTKAAMIEALRMYEEAHREQCVLIPSSDQFYGVSRGVNRLEKFIQWVFVPAVKDANAEGSETKNTALSKLIARTVRSKTSLVDKLTELKRRVEVEYGAILDTHQSDLDQLSTSLGGRLATWAHPGTSVRLVWTGERDKSVRVEEPYAQLVAADGAFEGRLARFGHGLQRCYLLALLQELAGGGDAGGPTLILGLEEPELFQHPPQAQHLADVLRSLSGQNSQVIVCTHSPYFVSGEQFEDVRLVRKSPLDHCSAVTQVTYEQLSNRLAEVSEERPVRVAGITAQIHQALQPSLNEMFFCPILVLVEGLEDIAYITTHLNLAGHWGEWHRLACHLVPANGKSRLIQPLAIATLMCIPTFVVFDADAHEADNGSGNLAKHARDNTVLLRLTGVTSPLALPTETFWGDSAVMWHSEMGAIVEAEFGNDAWRTYTDKARAQNGFAKGLDKNSLYIADLLSAAWSDGVRSPSLEELCKRILGFARLNSPVSVALAKTAST